MIYLVLLALCAYFFMSWWKADDEIGQLKSLLKKEQQLVFEAQNNERYYVQNLRDRLEAKEKEISKLHQEIRDIHQKYKDEKQAERYSLGELIGLKPHKKKEEVT